MKLFIVMYLAGHFSGSVGPLPYSMQECRHRAALEWVKGDPNVVTPEGYTRADVKFVCEFKSEKSEVR